MSDTPLSGVDRTILMLQRCIRHQMTSRDVAGDLVLGDGAASADLRGTVPSHVEMYETPFIAPPTDTGIDGYLPWANPCVP
jgi:hypothetical protein